MNGSALGKYQCVWFTVALICSGETAKIALYMFSTKICSLHSQNKDCGRTNSDRKVLGSSKLCKLASPHRQAPVYASILANN